VAPTALFNDDFEEYVYDNRRKTNCSRYYFSNQLQENMKISSNAGLVHSMSLTFNNQNNEEEKDDAVYNLEISERTLKEISAVTTQVEEDDCYIRSLVSSALVNIISNENVVNPRVTIKYQCNELINTGKINIKSKNNNKKRNNSELFLLNLSTLSSKPSELFCESLKFTSSFSKFHFNNHQTGMYLQNTCLFF
jgi:hypothetical protein